MTLWLNPGSSKFKDPFEEKAKLAKENLDVEFNPTPEYENSLLNPVRESKKPSILDKILAVDIDGLVGDSPTWDKIKVGDIKGLANDIGLGLAHGLANTGSAKLNASFDKMLSESKDPGTALYGQQQLAQQQEKQDFLNANPVKSLPAMIGEQIPEIPLWMAGEGATKALGTGIGKLTPSLTSALEKVGTKIPSFVRGGLMDAATYGTVVAPVESMGNGDNLSEFVDREKQLPSVLLGGTLARGIGSGLKLGKDVIGEGSSLKQALAFRELNPEREIAPNSLEDIRSAYTTPSLRDARTQQYSDLFNDTSKPLVTQPPLSMGQTLQNQGLTDAELLAQKQLDGQNVFGGPLNNYKIKKIVTPEQKAYEAKQLELNDTFKDLPIGSADTPLNTNTLQENINNFIKEQPSPLDRNQRQSDLQKAFNNLPNQGRYSFTTGEQRALNELQDGIQTAQNYVGHTDVLAPYPAGTTIDQAYADIKANTGVNLPQLMSNWERAQGAKTTLTPQELSMGRASGFIPNLKPRESVLPTPQIAETTPINPLKSGLSGNLPVDTPVSPQMRPNIQLKPREFKQAEPIANIQQTPQRVLPELPERLTWTNKDNIPEVEPAFQSLKNGELLPKETQPIIPNKEVEPLIGQPKDIQPIVPNEFASAPIGEPKIQTDTPIIDPMNAKIPDASAHPVAEHIMSKLDDIEAAARARIAANKGRLNAGLPIDTMVDYGIIGATKIARGTVKYSVWAADMVNDLGNSIKPHLKDIWEEANKQHSLMIDGTFEHALPEPQSKIVIGKQKDGLSFKNAWDKFYTNIIDSQKPIGDLGKNTGTDIGKLASNTKNVGGIVDYNLLKGMVNKEGNKVGDSFKSVVESIPKGQEEEFWTYMSQRHNIDRAREGKPVQANYTSNMSSEAVKQIEQQHPEYKAIGDNITNWIDKFMQAWGVDTGIVNKDLYTGLRDTYKSYFPTQRDFSELEKAIPDNVSQKFADQRTPIRKATGSERDIIDPTENIMNLVNRTIRTAKYNEVGQSLLNTVRENPEKMKQFAEVIPVKDGMFANTDNIITVLEDGKPTYLKINNKPLLDAMNGLPKSIGNIPVLTATTNAIKGLITQKNPIFAVRNISRDIPTAYVYGSEKNPFKFTSDLIGAGKDILTNSPRLQRYQAVGGGGANFFNSSEAPKAAAELLGKKTPLKETLLHPLKTLGESKLIKSIETFNNLTETAPRLAEFNRVLDKTDDVTKALAAANDVTVNFARGGSLTKKVDKAGGMYVNASVQGLDKFFRGFRDPKTAVATLAKSGIAITTPTVALYLMNKDNPNYQALDNRTKDNYYLIPKSDGTFIKIPKSRELGVLFGSLFERALRQNEGQQNSFKGFGNSVATNLAPANPLESSLLTPWLDLSKNKDFADRAIVPQSMLMDKRSPYLQYDDKTSSIAKTIGELSSKYIDGGLSPKQLDYLIKSYSGVIGQFGIPLATPGGDPGKTLSTQFTADPTFSNQVTTDFYDKLDKLSTTATDKNITGKIPSKKLTPEEDMRNSMNGVSSALSRGTKLINSIQASDDPLKDDKIKEIKTRMLQLISKAVAANDPSSMQSVESSAKNLWK
jgi:hypothetical protein